MIGGNIVVLVLIVSIVVVMGDIGVTMSVMIGFKDGMTNGVVLRNDMLRMDSNLMVAVVAYILVVVMASHGVIHIVVGGRLSSVVFVNNLMSHHVLDWVSVMSLYGTTVMVMSHLYPVIVTLGQDLMRPFNLIVASQISLPECIDVMISLVSGLVVRLVRGIVRRKMLGLDVLASVRMDVKVCLLVIMLITIVFVLMIVDKPIVSLVSNRITSFDPASNLV